MALLNLNPFPSSIFFFTLSLGSGEIFLASPGLKKPSLAQEVKVKINTNTVEEVKKEFDIAS